MDYEKYLDNLTFEVHEVSYTKVKRLKDGSIVEGDLIDHIVTERKTICKLCGCFIDDIDKHYNKVHKND